MLNPEFKTGYLALKMIKDTVSYAERMASALSGLSFCFKKSLSYDRICVTL